MNGLVAERESSIQAATVPEFPALSASSVKSSSIPALSTLDQPTARFGLGC